MDDDELPPVLELGSVELDSPGDELDGVDGTVDEVSVGVLLLGGLGDVRVALGVSSREGEVPGGSVVPGGMTVPGGSGVPGGSTIGCSPEPSGGSSVTTCVPSGLVVTTAVRVPAGIATPSTVTGAWPGAASPGTSWAPELVLAPFGTATFGESPGATSEASPPNAVASTTPLTASST
ncbi:hypothetical protein [Amycolatopsis thermophila]|uniref:Uncharacterized protein n=1 Tax=Amycolatopsis thermophila TaxID=206084 RepID=A0ABU0EPN1_9PSEU|nr:hypothetical protein [Amycolatopsis thermophila]MDQ0376762.1 hypothetical protein [Amycolatopsis thermophila]